MRARPLARIGERGPFPVDCAAMLTRRPVGQPRPIGPLLVLATMILSTACTSNPTTSPVPDSPQGSPATSPGASSAATPNASATSPLFGQPAPVDPCEVLDPREIQTVLEGPFMIAAQETSGGAAASCVFTSEGGESRVAVTVIKAPVTLPEFQGTMRAFGDRAVPVTDLGVPTGLVIFGPTASVYALVEDLEIYIDLVKEDRTGGQITGPVLALMERALSRIPGGPAPGTSGGPPQPTPSASG